MMDKTTFTNPANEPQKRANERSRIPMSVPLQKLEVPEIPGYHLHWMRGTPARIQQALKAGYEFVEAGEVELNETGLGTVEGNQDMGTRISVIGGTDPTALEGENTLVLMKIRQEWYDEDQKLIADRNESIAAALRGGNNLNQNPEDDPQARYVPESARRNVATLFTKKSSR